MHTYAACTCMSTTTNTLLVVWMIVLHCPPVSLLPTPGEHRTISVSDASNFPERACSPNFDPLPSQLPAATSMQCTNIITHEYPPCWGCSHFNPAAQPGSAVVLSDGQLRCHLHS
eukprot:EG_transcript_35385